MSTKRTALLVGALWSLALSACGQNEQEPDCTKSGVACNWLGIPGMFGFNGDGHDKKETELYWAMDVYFTRDDTPWFVDWNNHQIRKVNANSTVTTVVGWTDPVFPGDGAQDESTAAGAPGSVVQLNHPTDLAEQADGSLLIMAWHNHKLRRLDPAGNVHIVAGDGPGFAGDSGPVSGALFKQPSALEIDDDGNQFLIDQQNWRIRRIDPQGVITTIAGTGKQGFSGDGGPALQAQFSWDFGSNPEPNGGLAHLGRNLYVSDTLNNRIRVIDLSTGVVDTLAGSGEQGFGGDEGDAKSAKLNHPRDLEIGPDGNLYVADTDNQRIRKIDLTSHVITTVVGTGELGLDAEDGLMATQTKLRRPFGLGFDHAGNLYVCDSLNSRILKVAR